jgi:hypothetical protein
VKARAASPFTSLVVLSAISLVLAIGVAVLYSYDSTTSLESAAGTSLLLVITVGLWFYRRRVARRNDFPAGRAILVGLGLGLLWAVEIGINNFVQPPLPDRDIIDNIFWAVIAISILGLAIVQGIQTRSLRAAIEAGAWSGFASGLLACIAALAMILFGMGAITRDPLNLAEWAGNIRTITAPTMADYFAYETYAGAFLHLLVLGIGMGGLLGVAGGIIVKGIQWGTGSREKKTLTHRR